MLPVDGLPLGQFLKNELQASSIILLTSTCLWRWNRQSVPKRRHLNSRRRVITQKKAYKFHHIYRIFFIFLKGKKGGGRWMIQYIQRRNKRFKSVFHWYWSYPRANWGISDFQQNRAAHFQTKSVPTAVYKLQFLPKVTVASLQLIQDILELPWKWKETASLKSP